MSTLTVVRDRFPKTAMRTLNRQKHNEIVEALQAHAGLVIQSAARVLGNIDEAQDVAQDLAEKLLRSPPGDVRSWPALLKTMAVNASIDRLRRRRDEVEVPELRANDDPEQAMSRGQKAAALTAALASLSARDAALFSLFYLVDLPQADIAHQMEMSRSAVGVALHRVRQRLAQLIDPSLKPETAGEPNS